MASDNTAPPPPPAPAPIPAPPVAPLSVLLASGQIAFMGLLWGGVQLAILALWLWLKFKNEGSPVLPLSVAVVAAVGIGLALWHAFVLWMQKITPEQRAIALSAQRRTTGLVLLAGGAALILIALFLGFMQRTGSEGGGLASLKANAGEVGGLILLALIALGAGRLLLDPPSAEPRGINFDSLRNLFPTIRAALFILGIIAIIVFCVLVFQYKAWAEGWGPEEDRRPSLWPELVGLLLFSMACVGLGLWLTSIPTADAFTTRVVVLVVGGVIGATLFFTLMLRLIASRSTILLGGLSAWQGDGGWKLWVCIYLILISLALMYGSLMLARADVHANAILRRALFGYNAIVGGLLVIAILLVMNIAGYAMIPYTFDWTKTRGLHSLNLSSKHLLHELRKPVNVYVLLSEGMASRTDMRVLLDNLQAESDKVKVKFISPDESLPDYQDLAEKFPKILPEQRLMRGDSETGRGILMVYGEMPQGKDHKVPYAFIAQRKLYDTRPAMGHGEKATRTFKGEVEVMKELNYLVRGQTTRKLLFLQGNDELDIGEMQPLMRQDLRVEMAPLGVASLVDRLKKDNYEVQAITFSKEYAEEHKRDNVLYVGEAGSDKKPEIPKDAYALVIAGASKKISADGLAAIEKYMERGGENPGKLMALFDVVLTDEPKAKDRRLKESGLEGVLKKYGIDSTDEMVVVQAVSETGAPLGRPIDPFKLLLAPPRKTDNVLAKQFFDTPIQVRTARVIRPSPGGRFKAEPAFTTIPGAALRFGAAIADRDYGALDSQSIFGLFKDLAIRGELRKKMTEELPIIVAVSDDVKPRMVVFGDTEFINNAQIGVGANYSVFVSALEWMAEHEGLGGVGGLVGPQPVARETVEMPRKYAEDNFTHIHMIPMWLMLITIIGLGGGIWLVRRR